MATIIAAKVGEQERGEAIAVALERLQVASEDVQIFYVNPPGQHATHPVGGDVAADPGTDEATTGQAAGATAGAAVGAVVGAAAAVAAPLAAPALLAGMIGVGAHVGGLAGAVSRTRDADEEHEATDVAVPGPQARDTRRGGLMIAVHVRNVDEARVIAALRELGAHDIERAHGTWKDGDWEDFNALDPPQLVDNQPHDA
jgi:hypothetical protein